MSVSASSVSGTIVVYSAFYPVASNERISVVTRGAFASSSVIGTVTNSVASARIAKNARVYTFSVVALLIVAAFAVSFTTGFHASKLRISAVSWFTETSRIMVSDFAFGVRSAIARCYAYSIHARFAARTIGIRRTSHGYRFYGWKKRIKIEK